MGRVDNKVVIVTGGASGIGEADCRALIAEGARVVITDVDEAKGEKLASALGSRALFVRQDVRDEAQWDHVISVCASHHGRLDALVNNAGVVMVGTVEDTSLEMWRMVNEVDSTGVFLGCKAAIPLMKKSGGGSIVNISSVAALSGFPQYFAYVAAKGAVRAMTRSIAAHCAKEGYKIRCNTIHPGGIATPMLAGATRDAGGKTGRAGEPAGSTPIGEPEDVANMVVYLVSDESKFVNAAELVIDGGLLVL